MPAPAGRAEFMSYYWICSAGRNFSPAQSSLKRGELPAATGGVILPTDLGSSRLSAPMSM